jgi:hypothetical protein
LATSALVKRLALDATPDASGGIAYRDNASYASAMERQA